MFAISPSRLRALCALKQSMSIFNRELDALTVKISNNSATPQEARLFRAVMTVSLQLQQKYDKIAPKTKRQQRQLDRHIQSCSN